MSAPEADGQRWLVTGATSGIGAAVTSLARERGAMVWALEINDQAGAALEQDTGASYVHCDVSSESRWQEVAASISSTPPTHVHLNAGIQIAPPSAPLSAYTLEAATTENYRRMMGVNVDGVVFGLRALLPILQPGAHIVVTASLAGITPYDVDPLYAMSKHAVVGLVRSIAPALKARQITINALCPGGIDTNIIPEAQRTEHARFMTPACIAQEVMNLMLTNETGKSWAKVAEAKPAFIVRAPGDRDGK